MYFISELFTNIKKHFSSKNEVFNVPIDRPEDAPIALDFSQPKMTREIARELPRLPSDIDSSIFRLSIVEIRILICLINYDSEHKNMVVFDSTDREVVSADIIARDILMKTLAKLREKGFIETVGNKEIASKKHFKYFLSKKTYENIDYIVLLIANSKIIKPDRHSKAIAENRDLMKITFNQGSVHDFNLSFVLSFLYFFACSKKEVPNQGKSIYCGDFFPVETSMLLGINKQTLKQSLRKLKKARFINYRACRHAETLHNGYSISICFPVYSSLEDISHETKNCHYLPKTCLKKAKEAAKNVDSFPIQDKKTASAEAPLTIDYRVSEKQMKLLDYLYAEALKSKGSMMVDVNTEIVSKEINETPSFINNALPKMIKRGLLERIGMKWDGRRYVTYKVVVDPRQCVVTNYWSN